MQAAAHRSGQATTSSSTPMEGVRDTAQIRAVRGGGDGKLSQLAVKGLSILTPPDTKGHL